MNQLWNNLCVLLSVSFLVVKAVLVVSFNAWQLDMSYILFIREELTRFLLKRKLFDSLTLEDSYIDTQQIIQKVQLFWNVLTNFSVFFSCQHAIFSASPYDIVTYSATVNLSHEQYY